MALLVLIWSAVARCLNSKAVRTEELSKQTNLQSINQTDQVRSQPPSLQRSQHFITITEILENTMIWKALSSSSSWCHAKKHPSELLQLLRWNPFMFKHWPALPKISNVIHIPQKRSQILQVKPNHKPSQSLHLHKMFIFTGYRLREARQQIWPAAAHHANTASTNGRLAVKTLKEHSLIYSIHS